MARTEHEAAVDPVEVWRPQPNQKRFIDCPVHEVFFGGARGGGKSDAILGEWVRHATKHGKNAVGIVVRRELTQLLELIERSKVLYTPIGAKFNDQSKMWRFPNGARLRFAYLERDSDADNYIGSSFTRVYVEEIGTFPSPKPILKLMSCLRSGAGVPVGFRATGNPGGAGHSWVKARYVTPAPLGDKVIVDPESGLKRIFIPSKVADNKYLDQDKYVAQLRMSGSEQLVRAWLDGDWSAIESSFFANEWSDKVIIPPFAIPQHWVRLRSADWGFSTPFAVYWSCVVGDDYQHGDVTIPRGALVVYREWYGSPSGRLTEGLRMTAPEIANGILAREAGEKIARAVIDPSAFNAAGGPSYGEQLNKVLLGKQASGFMPGDNRRVAKIGQLSGWSQMRERLRSGGLYFFNTCLAAIETIPQLQHDPDNPEDLLKSPTDHAADAIRYLCMSRPWTGVSQEQAELQVVPPEVRKHEFLHGPQPVAVSNADGTVSLTNLETPRAFAERMRYRRKRGRWG